MPESWLEEVELVREARERFLKYSPESPIPKEDRKKFVGLKYYPADPGFKVRAILKRTPGKEEVYLETSARNRQRVTLTGELQFVLSSRKFVLLSFQGKGSSVFVPFKDLTNGSETYKLGRYLEVEAPEGVENVTIDFNLAYNPDCAYNSSIESLLPPSENTLSIPIRAGEMNYVR
jgi:uncharacterized protein (DUF1684 family)